MKKFLLLLLPLLLCGCNDRTFVVDVLHNDQHTKCLVTLNDSIKSVVCADTVQAGKDGQPVRLIVVATHLNETNFQVTATIEEMFGRKRAELVTTFNDETVFPVTIKSDSDRLQITLGYPPALEVKAIEKDKT